MIEQPPPRPAPTADLGPTMKAMERYIRQHDPLGPPGEGCYLPPREQEAPAWRALLHRLDVATGRAEPLGQLGLFDAPG